jgi:2-amino-4-hydroxy-6-hydroxymethyldihydropteridine diphosphokinase
MHRVFLSLGGNCGNREEYLQLAREQINIQVGKTLRVSNIFESEPWGFSHNTFFLNQVLEVKTSLDALCLLDVCNRIEDLLGRNRLQLVDEYEERTIDIDILFFDDAIFTLPPLVVPHRHIQDRMFVLEPLSQIASDLIHPLLCQSIGELKNKCQDQCRVWKFINAEKRVEA